MKTLEHWADTPEGRERYRANEPTIEIFIKDVEELEKSQRALEETIALCGKCQEERKARDAQTLKFCDEALSDLPKGDCYKTIYAITKIKKLLV